MPRATAPPWQRSSASRIRRAFAASPALGSDASGLGWISVGALASLRKADSMRLVLDVWVPKGVQVALRPPMPISKLPNAVPVFGDDADGEFDDALL